MQLLTIHEILGNTSFHIIRLLCLAGILPMELANVAPPLCPGCSYGKANQRPWSWKGKSNIKKIKLVTIPGQVGSVDQLVRYTPRLIRSHQGLPTTKRYSGATIFVDNASDFTSVCLEMLEDILTNPLPTTQFKKLRELIMGWTISWIHYPHWSRGSERIFDQTGVMYLTNFSLVQNRNSLFTVYYLLNYRI